MKTSEILQYYLKIMKISVATLPSPPDCYHWITTSHSGRTLSQSRTNHFLEKLSFFNNHTFHVWCLSPGCIGLEFCPWTASIHEWCEGSFQKLAKSKIFAPFCCGGSVEPWIERTRLWMLCCHIKHWASQWSHSPYMVQLTQLYE